MILAPMLPYPTACMLGTLARHAVCWALLPDAPYVGHPCPTRRMLGVPARHGFLPSPHEDRFPKTHRFEKILDFPKR